MAHLTSEESEAECTILDQLQGQPFSALATVCALLFRDVYHRIREVERFYGRDQAGARPAHASRTLKQDVGEE